MSRVLAGAVPVLAVGWGVHVMVLRRQVETARRDPLTGLHTRAAWSRRARQVITGPSAVVLLVDLDDFKAVNDTRGHQSGDAVLVAVATRLRTWAGPGAAVGRLGGDEFVVAVHIPACVTPGEGVGAWVQELAGQLQRPVAVAGGPVSVGASIGYVHVSGGRAADLQVVLGEADAAMYAIKTTHHRTRPQAVIATDEAAVVRAVAA